MHYVGANGARIPNLGEVSLDFVTRARKRGRMVFQVADVKKPLLAVSTLARTGHDVIFSDTGGKVINRKTKQELPFVKRNGIYVLEVLVAPPPEGSGQPGFARQGQKAAGHP